MSTLDKYRRISQESPKTEEDEIRVTGRGRIGMYISYAAKLFLEKKLTKCIIKGSGPAISKVCQTAEILRQRIKGLHQQSKIYSTNITDIYEPLEEGLDKVEVSKSLTVYEVILSLNESDVDTKSSGYQEPLPESEVVGFKYNYDSRPEFSQRRGRGGRGQRYGRGQGYGRGFNRRGGRQQQQYQRPYDNYNNDYQDRPQRQRRPPRYEDDDYYQEQPRRGGARRQQQQQYQYEDEDYYRQDNRRRQQQKYEDDDYEQPRRRGGRRGGRTAGGENQPRDRDYRNKDRDYQQREEEPKVNRRPRGNRRF